MPIYTSRRRFAAPKDTFCATQLDRQTNRLKTAKTRCSPLTRLANQRDIFFAFFFSIIEACYYHPQFWILRSASCGFLSSTVTTSPVPSTIIFTSGSARRVLVFDTSERIKNVIFFVHERSVCLSIQVELIFA